MHGQMKGSRVLGALRDAYHRLVTLNLPSDGTSRVGRAHRPDILDLLVILQQPPRVDKPLALYFWSSGAGLGYLGLDGRNGR